MKSLIFLMVISIVLVTAESLRCYRCFKCDDGYKNDKNLVTCDDKNAACLKGVLSLTNKTTIVSRDCMGNDNTPSTPIGLVHYNVTEFSSTSIYFCRTDSCNGAGSLTAVFSIIFTTLIALIFANESS